MTRIENREIGLKMIGIASPVLKNIASNTIKKAIFDPVAVHERN
jgi:hypothetical protein